ncbi:MAG: nucleotidyl transferase AbiEii/AbiGii toxin family protein [Cytophagales bacterium]|nr:nucleotidyl transferase AbiEii/AbiGii toxin family protein [Cytophagales bacterium]
MIQDGHIRHWLALPNTTKLNVFQQTATQMGLPANAIEKDWWVVQTLNIIFSMPCAEYLVFKGGTSLSKGWNLIQRFSEDIDLALDRKFLGFEEELDTRGIKNLRKASFNFITKDFAPQLQMLFIQAGFTEVVIKCQEVKSHSQDPLIIEIYYPKLTEMDSYLKPGVLVEVGSRSLKEPFTIRSFNSLVADRFSGQNFADAAISLAVVNPERTFLEKIFLLHEEFQKPADKIRVNRLSRHLYDIEKLSQTSFATTALQDPHLYQTIVQHRSMLTPIAGIDYSLHSPANIRFVPPIALLELWEADYKEMLENMIHESNALAFKPLIVKLNALQQQINSLSW